MNRDYISNVLVASVYIVILGFMVFTMLYPISSAFIDYGFNPMMDNLLNSWGYILWAGFFLSIFIKKLYYS